MVLGHDNLFLMSGMVADFCQEWKWLQVIPCLKSLETLKEKKKHFKFNCGTCLLWLVVHEQEPWKTVGQTLHLESCCETPGSGNHLMGSTLTSKGCRGMFLHGF